MGSGETGGGGDVDGYPNDPDDRVETAQHVMERAQGLERRESSHGLGLGHRYIPIDEPGLDRVSFLENNLAGHPCIRAVPDDRCVAPAGCRRWGEDDPELLEAVSDRVHRST
ncbi:MAG: hypothetical protein LVQ64_06640 [Thermoplasmatales archaeon]|nr:hypothetical protein [Thermoplasmatales archaeon]